MSDETKPTDTKPTGAEAAVDAAAKPEESASNELQKEVKSDQPAEEKVATEKPEPEATAATTPAQAAPATTPPIPAAETQAEPSEPKTEAASPTPAAETATTQESKLKRGLFGRRKSSDTPATTTPPLTAETVIEALDPGTAPKVTAEELAKQLDAQLESAKAHSGAWTFSLTKDKLLVLSALLLLLVWMVPTLDLVRQLRSEPEPSPAVESASIRVKYAPDSLPDAEAIKVLLETKDLGPVELVEEAQDNPGVSLVGKPSNPGLATAALLALSSDYQVATGSSILTEDSQVSVLILVGPQATDSATAIDQ